MAESGGAGASRAAVATTHCASGVRSTDDMMMGEVNSGPRPVRSARTIIAGFEGRHSLSTTAGPTVASASLNRLAATELMNTAAFSGGRRMVVPDATGWPRATAR